MSKKPRVCICGGGNLAHALVGTIGANSDFDVCVLTRQPERWANEISVFGCNGAFKGKGHASPISNRPEDVVSTADIIFLALPSFSRAAVLSSIAPFVKPNSVIGCFPGIGGFDWLAEHFLPIDRMEIAYFSSQRVPFICRTMTYGHSVMADAKNSINVAFSSHSKPSFIGELQTMLGIGINTLKSFMEVNLSNSNPLLHPARMYSLFSNYSEKMFFKAPMPFYEDWDQYASEILISMDMELQSICPRMGCKCHITPIMKHYGVDSALALTDMIRRIPSFKGIMTPMIQASAGYFPDFNSRYFTEDIAYGTLVIKFFAEQCDVPTPTIDRIITWAQGRMEKEYLVGSQLAGRSCKETILQYIPCLNPWPEKRCEP